jgi:hypothetical protein
MGGSHSGAFGKMAEHAPPTNLGRLRQPNVSSHSATVGRYRDAERRDSARCQARYARQCRAFGLTMPSLRDKDKMWRATLLGAIGLAEWHAPEIRDLGALLERRKSINCWHPPARKILLQVTRPQSTRQCRGAARSSFAGKRTHSANSPQIKRASTWMCSIAWSVRMRQASPPLALSGHISRPG